MGYILTMLCLFLLAGGVFALVWIFRNDQDGDFPGPGDDRDDDEGGLPIDFDAPLDLPPGVYTLPPEPVRS
ncbi:MAG: hypothetical protein NWR72_08050 [Bacteroidia bacterium]|nr:hypothetical protein [Bacteroidia bacterium]